ncbi:thioredoxin family protein [Stenotrophomonas sp. 24(2023)]|uniref:thioredoxin family protein n=1 Tax=Stenotrophomonas sp. 24(2023) TaxID=3068324 RepID=UPI0027E0D4D7|nr:thioredoxin family protein [Stenotrophomonas sp. 24(2023)]WMJ69466.1 thioredoxin family protein [Stenotrophomonas sp. 24(2023)]
MQIIDATTPEQYRQLLAEHPRVLVDFHKDQCPGCRMLEMSLQRVGARGIGQGMTLLRVQLEVVGEAFFRDLGLRQTPTLALFRDGDERTRLAGFQSPAQIEAAITQFLA